ncbi:hypothetical protein BGZ75_004333 [Mortierella antarctica]|nr:hypothetical protein BGZ75_004333 [Mortierella antarctica]
MSTKDLQIGGIESITFSLSSDRGKSHYAVERITRQRLQSLSKKKTPMQLYFLPTTGMSKWQLYRKLDASACKGDQMLTMEVRLSNEALFSQLNPGSIEIQFIELNSQRPKSLGLHGNGEYLVTLRTTTKQLLVEVWDFRYLDSSETPGPVPPRSRACCTMYIPLTRAEESKGEIPEYPFQISTSWDATQIAVTFTGWWRKECPWIQDFQDYFGIYRTSSAAERSYQPSLFDYQHCKRLHNFGGGAKFHITAAENQDVRNELYIACTGREVQIYSVHGRWRLLRTITLLPLAADLHSETLFSWGVIERLQGRFFPWYDNANNDLAVWDLEEGAVVSYFAKKGPCTVFTMHEDDITGLSKDGSTLAFYRQGEITTYRMATGTLLGSCLLPPGYEDVTDVKFIRKDSQILLCARAQDEDYGAGNLGLVLDVATLSVEDRFVVPSGAGTLSVRYSPRQGYDSIYSIESDLSTLELYAVKDLIRKPYSLQHLARHEPCLGTLAPLSTSPTEFASPTGLIFTARIICLKESPQDFESPSVIVHIRHASGDSRTFVIPPLPESIDIFGDIDFGRTYRAAIFLDSFARLVVQSPALLMIWGLPTTLQGDFVLLVAWSTSSLPTGSRWVTCAHQQLYSCRTVPDAARVTGEASDITDLYPDIDHAFSTSSVECFLEGMLIAMEIYDRANPKCKQAILRYFSRHVNSYPASDGPSANVMSKICHAWTPELRTSCKQFTEALLSSDFARWVPRLDMDRQWNPLGILLQKSKTEPRAMGLAEVIIDYCVRQATKDRDLTILRPIMQCLDEFTDQKQSHWDLALSILQRVAFVPAKDRSFVVDNHTIAYPVAARFHWKLWKAQLPPLYMCKDPVLQLMYAPGNERNAQNDNFTRGLYVTSFDLLWRRKSDHSNQLSLRSGQHPQQGSRVQFGIKLSWANVVLQLIRLKCRLKSSEEAIECHDLQLEAFDNPALAALIEYKCPRTRHAAYGRDVLILPDRNTIGFKYWLARSVYNYVDLAAFGLPLAGSINQLVALANQDSAASRSGILSFSILFVFLHMGGRYDAINSDLDSNNWAFHTMMIIYFFFTVILMLNVLIGLVNLAFNDGDRTWRLVWLENRLRYIESAENLTYMVPGFRQTYSWFPDEIYFSATPQEIKEYTKRWVGDDSEASVHTKNTSLLRPEIPTAQSSMTIPATAIDSRQNLQELKSQLQEEFKRELQAQLTEQRQEQQVLFEAQIRMLQEHMSTLMKSAP